MTAASNCFLQTRHEMMKRHLQRADTLITRIENLPEDEPQLDTRG
jgi:hypothetical protein